MPQIGEECEKGNRRSQIIEQIDVQNKFLTNLEENWEGLFNRLSPLVREPEPEKERVVDKIPNTLVPLAGDLQKSNGRIYRIAQQIADTILRLEL